MKKKFVLTRNSFNAFRGLNDDQMAQVRGGLPKSPNVPYYPTCGGCGGGELPIEHKPFELEPNKCEEGYVWDNVLNECVRA
ncbi:MAG: hypothetical protein AAFO69_12825 [Bacteroidota bacterium]